MTLPKPIPGLVITYYYLWSDERRQGIEEGRKSRPCAIVTSRQLVDGHEIITAVPITHTPPSDFKNAVLIPPAVKAMLGLDDQPSWIVVTEMNVFNWPGPDLQQRSGLKASGFEYGVLPPNFFKHVRACILAAHLDGKLKQVVRSH